jgi:formate C-acetyltransferase
LARGQSRQCLLYAINGGRDEITGEQVAPSASQSRAIISSSTNVAGKLETMMDWLAGVYVSAMNVIHYMHDKYAYERIEMALHDFARAHHGVRHCRMSVVADSLSAIKHAKVKVIRDKAVLSWTTSRGQLSVFGNNDNRVDHLATWLVSTFMGKLRKYPTYRNALHTQSV